MKCPSTNLDGSDRFPPASKAIDTCAQHLRAELEAARPERVLALGGPAIRGVIGALGLPIRKGITVAGFAAGTYEAEIGGRIVPVAGSLFPGTPRKGAWEPDGTSADIVRILARHPRDLRRAGS